MAVTSSLFYFYQNYLWTAGDFDTFQASLVNLARGTFEGLTGQAIYQGGTCSISPTGLNTPVDSLIACGPTGNLMVVSSVTNIVHTAPITNPQKNLVVVRPSLSNTNNITNPNSPFQLVPLNQVQGAQVVLIAGTPAASPAYPATLANDVILWGVTVQPGQTSFTVPRDLDLEVRDIVGKNSKITQDTGKYDNRCRPYYSSNQSLGVKPSQTTSTNPRAFTYVGSGIPSKFPQDVSNLFVDGDTLINFQTGAITGADAISADFTPTIPTTGNAIVATLSLGSDSQLQVNYGVIGTFTQCFAGIVNAVNATGLAAGSVNYPKNRMKIAYVILFSDNGTSIRDYMFFDARTVFNYGSDSPDLVTIDLSSASNTIASGQSQIYGQLIIPSGQTWTVNGSLFVMESITVQSGGTLTVPGTARVV